MTYKASQDKKVHKLKHYNKTNPLPWFYQFGMTPKEIKQAIIDAFSPYFIHKEQLKKYATSHLINTWLGYLSINRDNPDSVKQIGPILEIFNGAKEVNPSEAYEAYSLWFPSISQSMSRFWTIHNNQLDFDDLENDEYLDASLNLIGQIIEGVTKDFLKLLLHLSRIKRKKTVSSEEINNKDLGLVVDELLSTSELNEILILEPYSIRLNQWRNIAYHHNTEIVGDEMIFWFNKNGGKYKFELAREELRNILKRVILTFYLVRISETIFCFDNLDEIQQKVEEIDESKIKIRDEARLIDLYSSTGSQGFKIIGLKSDNDKSILSVKDMMLYVDATKRAILSSQLLYFLWHYSSSKLLSVEYFLGNGEKFSTSEINSRL